MSSNYDDMIEALGAIAQRDEDLYDAVLSTAAMLRGKNENYVGVEDANAFDNFETVSLMKQAIYRGLPIEAATGEAAAVLDQILHKIARLVRGAEWNSQVGEGTPDAARDLKGYATILDGLFKRRARLAEENSDADKAAAEYAEWDALRPVSFTFTAIDEDGHMFRVLTGGAGGGGYSPTKHIGREFTDLELALAYQTANHDGDIRTWEQFNYVKDVLTNQRGVRERFIEELAEVAIGMLEREFTDREVLDACLAAWALKDASSLDFGYLYDEVMRRGLYANWEALRLGVECDHA